MVNLVGINVTTSIVPGTTEDIFPTHMALYGKGGWREVATVAERDAIPDPRLEVGMSVYVASEKKLYILSSLDTTTTPYTKTWSLFSAGGVTVMPTPSETELGNIVQYIGETTENYTQGYFYKCVSDGADPASYSWEQIDVQPATDLIWGNIEGDITNQTDLNTELTNLQEQIDSLSGRGRYLSVWNCTTGLAETIPSVDPYPYKTGDYFIVGTAVKAEPESCSMTIKEGSTVDVQFQQSMYKSKVGTSADREDVFAYTTMRSSASVVSGDEKLVLADQNKFSELWNSLIDIANQDKQPAAPEITSISKIQFRWFYYSGTLFRACEIFGLDANNVEYQVYSNILSSQVSGTFSYDEQQNLVSQWLLETFGIGYVNDLYVPQTVMQQETWHAVQLSETDLKWTLNGEDLPEGETIANYGLVPVLTQPALGDIITIIYRTEKVNYKPDGTEYSPSTPSTVIETKEVEVDDTYVYDGLVWHLLKNNQKELTFTNIAGSPYDNVNLANALNAKQDVLTPGTNITIAEDSQTGNLVISSTAQESFFRGNFNEWSDVPIDTSLYVEDIHGNRIPQSTDFIVIEDASQFIPIGDLMHHLTVENIHSTENFTIRITDENGVSKKYYYSPYQSGFVAIDDYYSLRYAAGNPGYWYIKTNDGSPIVVKGTTYQSGAAQLCITSDPATPFYVGMPPSAGQYQGAWRFAYYGAWSTDGTAGWTPQYKIENTLPDASDTVKGIAKLYTDLGENTDGAVDQATVTTELGKKQDTLTAGTGISINEDNEISATFSESYFRGKFSTWDAVPTDYRSYYPDYTGSTKPTRTDYMVVEDPSSYVKPGTPIEIYQLPWQQPYAYVRIVFGATDVTLDHASTHDNPPIIGTVGNRLRIEYDNYQWKIIPLDIPVIVDGVEKPINEVAYSWSYNNGSSEYLQKTINFIGQSGYEGTWRFSYQSDDWDTSGKNGWEPEYQIEDVLPIATDTVAGITKLYTTTGSNTDGTMDQNSITTELGKKQDVLTAGNNITIDANSKIDAADKTLVSFVIWEDEE